jgi:hypothetical protein
MRLFELLLPLAKGMEALKLGRGLSLIGVGRKRQAAFAKATAGQA